MSGQNSNSNSHIHLNAHSSPLYNSQDVEPTQKSTYWGLDKEVVVYLSRGILLSHEKDETMSFVAT